MTVSPGMVDSVPLVGLVPCTAYTVRVVARVGEEFSDEEEVVFTTCDGGRRSDQAWPKVSRKKRNILI